jgi:proton-translocating NADH-quinone oxidoreductase chain L
MITIFLTGVTGLTVLLFGRWFGENGSKYLTVGGIWVTFLSHLFLHLPAFYGKKVFLFEGPVWFQAGWLEIRWTFWLDSLSIFMLVVILGISALVHTYSMDYMKGDPHLSRFLAYLSLFTFFMALLVTAGNFIQLFLGWEGVGLCSYLLINFWFTRKQANKSALKAMVANRVGDIGLMLAFCLIYWKYKSLDFSVFFLLTPFYQEIPFWFGFTYLEVVGFFLVLGAIGKSAQLGLHIWLPDAMEGPTPVSALIHAATMVTAGVFLVVRCSNFFEYVPSVLALIAFLGGLTALFAASTGFFQNDLKKVIAYSTCSQLGYMFLACGVSAYDGAMFHLFTHAFFKALLFLGAGGVIHSFLDEQDLRKMGGLSHLLPFTYTAILVGSISLMGLPFLSGFYSKEWILELVASRSSDPFYLFLYGLGVLSAMLTSIYSVRLIYLAFLSLPRSSSIYYKGVHEVPFWMGLTFFLLMICSIWFGYFFRDMLIGLGTDVWNYSIFVDYQNYSGFEAEFLPFFIKLIPLIGGIMGASLSYLVHSFYSKGWILWLKEDGNRLLNFLNQKWYFDHMSNWLVRGTLREGYHSTFKHLDRGAFEWYGPTGLVWLVRECSLKVSQLQSGYLYHYLGWMVLGVISFLFLLILTGPETFLMVSLVCWILYIGNDEKRN